MDINKLEHDNNMRIIVGAINEPTCEADKVFAALKKLPINIQIGVVAFLCREKTTSIYNTEKFKEWLSQECIFKTIRNEDVVDIIAMEHYLLQSIIDMKIYVCQWVASG